MVAVVGIAVVAAAAVEVKFVVVVGDQLALAELANAFVIVMENVVVVVKEGIVESENAKADQEVSVVAVVVAAAALEVEFAVMASLAVVVENVEAEDLVVPLFSAVVVEGNVAAAVVVVEIAFAVEMVFVVEMKRSFVEKVAIFAETEIVVGMFAAFAVSEIVVFDLEAVAEIDWEKFAVVMFAG